MTVQLTTLANGLRVVSDHMDSVETVSLGVWVGAGARHETAAINGVSHLLEHMAFKGTERRSALDIAEQVEAVGGHLNAYTSRESTAFYAKMLKADSALGIDIIADILQYPTMTPDELAREQDVIVQEINEAGDTPDDAVFDHFQAAAFPGQALGRPVLGSAENVRAMDRDTVKDYMRSRYASPVMMLAAAGNIDHETLVRLASEQFTALPAAGDTGKEAARYVGGEHIERRDLEQMHVLVGFEGIAITDDAFYAGSVFSTLFGGGMSSRLFQEIREKRGLAYSVYSFLSSYTDSGLFGIYAGTGEDRAEEVVRVIGDEMARVQDGIKGPEIDRAKAQLKASILMALESTSSRCEQMAQQFLVYGRAIPTAEIIERIDAVGEAEMIALAERFCASNPTLAALGPVPKGLSVSDIAVS